MNPFQYSGIVEGEAYFQRKSIESIFAKHLKSGQNLLLQGPRRVGKSSSVFNFFSSKKNVAFIHVDFFGVTSESKVAEKLQIAFETSKTTHSNLNKALAKINSLQAFGVGLEWGGRSASLPIEQLLKTAHQSIGKKKLVFFFDEFQSLLDLPNSNEVLGGMRSAIQTQSDILYIFCGSEENRMREMFFANKSPFFKSVFAIDIGPMDRATFVPWLNAKFKMGNRTIADERVWDATLELTHNMPGDIQQICYFLWETSRPGDRLDIDNYQQAIEHILQIEEKGFISLYEYLPENQRRSIKGLTNYNGTSYSSREFLNASSLSSSSAARKALTGLTKKGVIWKRNERYLFTNPFMGIWVKLKL